MEVTRYSPSGGSICLSQQQDQRHELGWFHTQSLGTNVDVGKNRKKKLLIEVLSNINICNMNLSSLGGQSLGNP